MAFAIFGYTNVYMEGDPVYGRAQEVNLGDVTADANAWKALAATGGSIMVSLKNGGALCASVGSVAADGTKLAPSATDVKPSGGISQVDIENALCFNDSLIVFDTTAQGLKNILEYGTTLAAGDGGYAQLGGVRVAIDPTKASGSKVTDIALVDLAGNQIAQVWKGGAAVADAPSTISVVALDFNANGGDGYPIKTNATNFRYLLNNGTLSKAADQTTDLTAKAGFNSAGLDDTGSNLLREQKAFQDYLSAFHATPATAYGQADTTQSGDERIENLSLRSNVVFGVNSTGTDAADTLNGSATNDVLNGGGGNDSITAGGANDTIDGGAGTDTASFSAAQSTYRFGFRDGVIVVNGADGMDQLTNVEQVKFGTAAAVSVSSLQGSATDNGLIYANIAGKNIYAVADAYTGPVAGLVNQFLGGAFADTVLGSEKADFINALGGDDGVNGGGGNDVIDGGLGSNFIAGGAGIDRFFVDGRGAATSITWSTITDFSAGESLTIWGYKPNVSKFTWAASDGATGFKGVTLNADLDGNGVTDTSVTWAGLTQAQLPTQSYGSVGGQDYIFFG
jgi:Ca2+-binding RTX toxin-like protein